MVGAMVVHTRRVCTAVFALILAASATPTQQAAAAPGAWEWLSTRQGPGEFVAPTSAAADTGGVLYVADLTAQQIQRRDGSGNWTVVAALGDQPGEVRSPASLSVGSDGTLYVADRGNGRIQSRRPDGSWQVIDYPTLSGAQPDPVALAVQSDGTLNLVNGSSGRTTLWTRSPGGEWKDAGDAWTQEIGDRAPTGIAADSKGGLYVVETSFAGPFEGRLRYRSPSGEWQTVAPAGTSVGSVQQVKGVVATSAGDLYVLDMPIPVTRIQRRDSQGLWTVVPLPFAQDLHMASLAADGAGNLYLTRHAEDTVWWRGPAGGWTQVGTTGRAPGQVRFNLMWDVDPLGQVCLGQSSGAAWSMPEVGTITVLSSDDRIDLRGPGGLWQRAGGSGTSAGQVLNLVGVAASPLGELFAAEADPLGRLQRRSSEGSWTVLGSSSPIGGFNVNWALTSFAMDGQGTAWIAESGFVGTAKAMRLSARSSAGKWTSVLGETTGLYTEPHVLPDGSGGLYLWSHAATLQVGNEKAWPQHYDGKSWQDVQNLGSVWEMSRGPMGELYITTRDAGELLQVGPQGGRVKLASAGWGLGQVPPDLQVLRSDNLGRVYLCSKGGVQRYTPPSALVRGDVDGDGQVSIADVVLALRVVAGLMPSTPTLELRADVSPAGTGDGTLSIADATRLLRYLAGLEAGL